MADALDEVFDVVFMPRCYRLITAIDGVIAGAVPFRGDEGSAQMEDVMITAPEINALIMTSDAKPQSAAAFAGTDLSPEDLTARGHGRLPGHLGIVVNSVAPSEVRMSVPVAPHLLAPNGFLHAGALVTLADTAAGYGCVANLPAGANGFTTIELKSNHLATALDGTLDCVARPAHTGRTTQVWDATVTHRESGRTLALFRCTQMVLYPKG